MSSSSPSSQQVPFYITHPQTLYCHTCGRVISSGRGTKGQTTATASASNPAPESSSPKTKGKGQKKQPKSKQKKSATQTPSARNSVPKRCSERCRRAKPGAVERLVEEVFVAVLDGRLPRRVNDGGSGVEKDAGGESAAKRDSTGRAARRKGARNEQPTVQTGTEAMSSSSTVDGSSSSDDEGGVRITADPNPDPDNDDSQITTSNPLSQTIKPQRDDHSETPGTYPTWDADLRNRVQELIDTKRFQPDGTSSSSSSSSKSKRKKGDSRITVRCSEVLTCVFPDLAGETHRDDEGSDGRNAGKGAGNGIGNDMKGGLARFVPGTGTGGTDVEKQRQGMKRARTLEMVKQAMRRLVVFGYLEGHGDDIGDDDKGNVDRQVEGGRSDVDGDESGEISTTHQQNQYRDREGEGKGEGARRRFCEAVMGSTNMVVEPSFAKGDWAVRWRERTG